MQPWHGVGPASDGGFHCVPLTKAKKEVLVSPGFKVEGKSTEGNGTQTRSPMARLPALAMPAQ